MDKFEIIEWLAKKEGIIGENQDGYVIFSGNLLAETEKALKISYEGKVIFVAKKLVRVLKFAQKEDKGCLDKYSILGWRKISVPLWFKEKMDFIDFDVKSEDKLYFSFEAEIYNMTEKAYYINYKGKLILIPKFENSKISTKIEYPSRYHYVDVEPLGVYVCEFGGKFQILGWDSRTNNCKAKFLGTYDNINPESTEGKKIIALCSSIKEDGYCTNISMSDIFRKKYKSLVDTEVTTRELLIKMIRVGFPANHFTTFEPGIRELFHAAVS